MYVLRVTDIILKCMVFLPLFILTNMDDASLFSLKHKLMLKVLWCEWSDGICFIEIQAKLQNFLPLSRCPRFLVL